MPRSGLKWIVQVRGERGDDSDEDMSEDEPMLGEDTGIRGYSDVKSKGGNRESQMCEEVAR